MQLHLPNYEKMLISSSRTLSLLALLTSADAFFAIPWLCLERCGDDAGQIAAQLQQLRDHRADFTGASFELWNLGPNSTLIVNNLTRVSAPLNAMGLQTWGMVSSYRVYHRQFPRPPRITAH